MSEQDGFRDYARRVTLRNARALAAVIAVAAVVTWPLDLWLYPDDPRAVAGVAWARILGTLSAGGGAGLMFLLRGRPGLAFPLVVGTMLGCAVSTTAGFTMAGGLDLIAFQSLPMSVMSTAVALWPLRVRAFVAVLLAVAFLATFAIAGHVFLEPGYLRHPALAGTLANLGLGVLTSVVVGEMLTIATRRAFDGERLARERADRLAATEDELRGLNTKLEEVVERRTAELRRALRALEGQREDERRRIARELHDETGQQLTALRMEAALARRRAGDRAALEESLERVEALVDETLTATRELIVKLRPRELDDYGLGTAAEGLLARFGERFGLDIDWQVELPEPAIEGEHATATFRVLQEALTNVVRHAEASEVQVRLRADDDSITLVVADDGRGIGPLTETREGFGLVGMRERATALGGSLHLGSADPSGTIVRLELPRGAS